MEFQILTEDENSQTINSTKIPSISAKKRENVQDSSSSGEDDNHNLKTEVIKKVYKKTEKKEKKSDEKLEDIGTTSGSDSDKAKKSEKKGKTVKKKDLIESDSTDKKKDTEKEELKSAELLKKKKTSLKAKKPVKTTVFVKPQSEEKSARLLKLAFDLVKEASIKD